MPNFATALCDDDEAALFDLLGRLRFDGVMLRADFPDRRSLEQALASHHVASCVAPWQFFRIDRTADGLPLFRLQLEDGAWRELVRRACTLAGNRQPAIHRLTALRVAEPMPTAWQCRLPAALIELARDYNLRFYPQSTLRELTAVLRRAGAAAPAVGDAESCRDAAGMLAQGLPGFALDVAGTVYVAIGTNAWLRLQDDLRLVLVEHYALLGKLGIDALIGGGREMAAPLLRLLPERGPFAVPAALLRQTENATAVFGGAFPLACRGPLQAEALDGLVRHRQSLPQAREIRCPDYYPPLHDPLPGVAGLERRHSASQLRALAPDMPRTLGSSAPVLLPRVPAYMPPPPPTAPPPPGPPLLKWHSWHPPTLKKP